MQQGMGTSWAECCTLILDIWLSRPTRLISGPLILRRPESLQKQVSPPDTESHRLCGFFFSTPPNREPSLPFYGLFYLLCPLGGVERHLLYKLFDYYFCASVMLLWGGQTKAHSDAQEDAWKKILSFLQHNLYSSTSLRAKLWTVTYEHITAGGQWSSVWHHVYYLKTTIMCLAVLTRSEDWSRYHSIT